jgi:hypothetical protein
VQILLRIGSLIVTAGLTVLLILAVTLSVSSAQQTDNITGLLQEEGWQTVQANCTACHSALIITQNSGSREVWKSRIVWMQETQGLELLAIEVENTILDYLAINYGQKATSRRAGMPAHLLPVNPFDN